MMKHIILFDGVCNLCQSIVQFVIKRDRHAKFSFASLQGEAGQRLLLEHQISPEIDSFIYITKNRAYHKSEAALRVCQQLDGAWKIFYIFLIIPRPIRDRVYQFIARNRYKWFGKQDSCMLPTPELKKRFLDQ